MIFNSVAEIYDSIDKTRSRLLETLNSLDEGQRHAKENEEGWTVTQIAEHLGIVESGMGKIISRLLKQAEEDGVTSDGALNPPVSFEVIVRLMQGRKVEAPERVQPMGDQSLEESLSVLAENRKRLHEIRERLEAVDASNHTFPHPFFKELTAYQWLGMVGLHEMRHHEQIMRILEKAASSNAAAN